MDQNKQGDMEKQEKKPFKPIQRGKLTPPNLHGHVLREQSRIILKLHDKMSEQGITLVRSLQHSQQAANYWESSKNPEEHYR